MLKKITRIRAILLALLLTFSATTMAEEANSVAFDLGQYQGKVVYSTSGLPGVVLVGGRSPGSTRCITSTNRTGSS